MYCSWRRNPQQDGVPDKLTLLVAGSVVDTTLQDAAGMAISADDDTASANSVKGASSGDNWLRHFQVAPEFAAGPRADTKIEARCMIAHWIGAGLCRRPGGDYDCGGQVALANPGEV